MIHSIDIIAVVAAWVPVSVLSTSYWFCCGCWAVPLSYVTSCGACCSCWLIWALFFGCSLELISPHQYCHLQTSLTRNKISCKVVFCYSGCLSTFSMVSLFSFCIRLINFLLFDTMSGFPSVFIPSCTNVRVNSTVSRFSKELSNWSESFSKSSVSLFDCCCERR